ncbi:MULTISPECIES: molybdate ABC transporter substrate-binding protein [Micrococcaceae]|uniref:molybdate ABC transporter substrate-binding protein n=1 Tax=unclassified Kocuria TaxID=2649579 RepID=UPI00101314BF|nr:MULTISPECIES: molybdate ABC transporter substrate-binding protein [unclassified Kocuria]
MKAHRNTDVQNSARLRGRRGRLIGAIATSAVGLILLTGCGGQSNDSSSADDKTINVFAAASLNKAGDELASKYKESHSDTDIKWNYAGSSALVQQIDQGASPDIFVSADQQNMDKALKLDAFKDSHDTSVIATNTLQLVTAPGNPGNVHSIQDAADKPVAVCAAEVPCGTLAQQALDAASVKLDNASQEANVSAVSTKVSQGEVDAGFVYSTDALNMQKNNEDISTIDLKGIQNNQYPAALTDTGKKNGEAKDFYKWLKSDDAKQILEKYGFGSDE